MNHETESVWHGVVCGFGSGGHWCRHVERRRGISSEKHGAGIAVPDPEGRAVGERAE